MDIELQKGSGKLACHIEELKEHRRKREINVLIIVEPPPFPLWHVDMYTQTQKITRDSETIAI